MVIKRAGAGVGLIASALLSMGALCDGGDPPAKDCDRYHELMAQEDWLGAQLVLDHLRTLHPDDAEGASLVAGHEAKLDARLKALATSSPEKFLARIQAWVAKGELRNFNVGLSRRMAAAMVAAHPERVQYAVLAQLLDSLADPSTDHAKVMTQLQAIGDHP